MTAEAYQYLDARSTELGEEAESDDETMWRAADGEQDAQATVEAWAETREAERSARARAVDLYRRYLARGARFEHGDDDPLPFRLARPSAAIASQMRERRERVQELATDLNGHLEAGVPGFVHGWPLDRTSAQSIAAAERRAVRALEALEKAYKRRLDSLDQVDPDPSQPESSTNPPVENERDWLAALVRSDGALSWRAVAHAIKAVGLLTGKQNPDDSDVIHTLRMGATRHVKSAGVRSAQIQS